MTNFEQKYQEFREAFKEAALNNEFLCKIEKPYVSGYNGKITFFTGTFDIEITVADTFVCYHNKMFNDIFNEEEIKSLNNMISEYFDKDKERYNRIEQLKKELYKLENEVA